MFFFHRASGAGVDRLIFDLASVKMRWRQTRCLLARTSRADSTGSIAHDLIP